MPAEMQTVYACHKCKSIDVIVYFSEADVVAYDGMGDVQDRESSDSDFIEGECKVCGYASKIYDDWKAFDWVTEDGVKAHPVDIGLQHNPMVDSQVARRFRSANDGGYRLAKIVQEVIPK